MKSLLFFLLIGFSITALAEALPMGHPTIKDALQASGAPAVDDSTPLPNQGVVKSTIHSRGYTYIEVKQDDQLHWLAAPKVELTDGSTIRYGKGIPMTNFFSSGLQREFPEVLFIDRVQVVKQ